MAGQSRHACLQVTATADQTIGLTYIALDGDIGCMVNGAGLAMANMEIFGDVMSGSIFMKGTVGYNTGNANGNQEKPHVFGTKEGSTIATWSWATVKAAC